MSLLPPAIEWMNGCRRDLTLEEALADPLIKDVMRADGVDPRVLEADLRQTALEISWPDIARAQVSERCAPWC